jgi:hypothetical protein
VQANDQYGNACTDVDLSRYTLHVRFSSFSSLQTDAEGNSNLPSHRIATLNPDREDTGFDCRAVRDSGKWLVSYRAHQAGNYKLDILAEVMDDDDAEGSERLLAALSTLDGEVDNSPAALAAKQAAAAEVQAAVDAGGLVSINQSPFNISLEAGLADPTKTELLGKGCTEAQVAVRALFTVQVRPAAHWFR